MAAGDILSVTVRPSGREIDVVIEGLGTGGTYATRLGLGIDNDPDAGAPKIMLTVVSKGYNGTTPTTHTRTVYAVIPVQKAYPNHAQMEESFDGSNTTVRLALDDYIYDKDQAGAGNSGTDITYGILAGFYSHGGTDSAAATGTATNSSTAVFQKVVSNWQSVPYQRVTGNTLTLECKAYYRHAAGGKPVEAVVFSVSDGTTTVTSDPVTSMEISTEADECPVQVYRADVDVSSLTQGAVLTANYIAYPRIGDEDNLFDTSTGTAPPTPLYGPHKYLLDRTGGYGVTMAKVSPTGNDGTGVAYDSASYDYATAAAFLTHDGAAAAIAAYNNTNRSRNDVGGGVIETAAGSYNFMGGSSSYGTTPDCFCTIQAGPGVAAADVIFSGTSGNANISGRVELKNVKITSVTSQTFLNTTVLWWNQSIIDSASGTSMVHGTVNWYVTRCTVTSFRQGFRPFTGSVQVLPCLVRGNDLSGFKRTIFCYNVTGNKRTTDYAADATLFLSELTGMTMPYPDNMIIADNAIYGFRLSSFDLITIGAEGSRTHGMAIVNNVMEVTQQNGAAALGFICAPETVSTNTPQNNLMFWHNTLVGGRTGFAYNSVGSVTKLREYWSLKGNYLDAWGYKGNLFSDTITGGITNVGTTATATRNNHFLTTGDTITIANASPAQYNGTFVITVTGTNTFTYTMASDPGGSATGTPTYLSHQGRQGAEGVNYGAGFSGNQNPEPDDIGAEGAFPCRSFGLKSYQATLPGDPTYPLFVNRGSYDGVSVGAGDGDYNTEEGSPLRNGAREWVLPFDLQGRARTTENNDTGAFASELAQTIALGFIATGEAIHGLTVTQNIGLGFVPSGEAVHGLAVRQNVAMGFVASGEAVHGLSVTVGEEEEVTDPGAPVEVFFRRSDLGVEFTRRS